MIINLKNIGILQKASVEINGLTVIAGENDSGKSTIGKLAFSIIKGFQAYEEELSESKNDVILGEIEKIFFMIRRFIDFNENEDLRKEFYPTTFYKAFIDNYDLKIIEKKKNIILSLNLSEKQKNESIKILENIINIVNKEDSYEEKIVKSLNKTIESEFENEINLFDSKESVVELKDGVNKLFDLKINDNMVQNISIKDKLLPIQDVTFIESPIIFSFYNVIADADLNIKTHSRFKSPFRRVNTYFHIKDLGTKLSNTNYVVLENDKILEKLKNIMGGQMKLKKVNPAKNEFVFVKNKKNIKSINTAMGIKSFAIIDLLYRSNQLNPNNLLIIDEPEVHLHPKWQVEYAKLLIELVKNGIKVLVTSHSPYLIEALNKFSKEANLADDTNFYLTSLNSNGMVNIENKNSAKNEIFAKLSEPFEKLIWN